MSEDVRPWTVRPTASAEKDYQQIIEWTLDRFGASRALVYAQTLSMALEALCEGSEAAGARRRDDIAKRLFSLHVARRERKGRHLILFRVDAGSHAIEVLRLLHDSMDLPRHFAKREAPARG